jgi:hypothetical protein
VLAVARGDLPAGVRLCTEALNVFRAEDDRYWQTMSFNNLTLTKVLLGDMAGAAADHESTLAICQPAGECFFSGFSAMSLGMPGREPLSTSAFFTHSSSVCAVQPILAAIEDTAAQREEYSPS